MKSNSVILTAPLNTVPVACRSVTHNHLGLFAAFVSLAFPGVTWACALPVRASFHSIYLMCRLSTFVEKFHFSCLIVQLQKTTEV